MRLCCRRLQTCFDCALAAPFCHLDRPQLLRGLRARRIRWAGRYSLPGLAWGLAWGLAACLCPSQILRLILVVLQDRQRAACAALDRIPLVQVSQLSGWCGVSCLGLVDPSASIFGHLPFIARPLHLGTPEPVSQEPAPASRAAPETTPMHQVCIRADESAGCDASQGLTRTLRGDIVHCVPCRGLLERIRSAAARPSRSVKAPSRVRVIRCDIMGRCQVL